MDHGGGLCFIPQPTAERHERGPELEVAADDTCVPAAWCPDPLHGGFKEPEDKPAPQGKESPHSCSAGNGGAAGKPGPSGLPRKRCLGLCFLRAFVALLPRTLFQLPTPHLRSSSMCVRSQSNSFHPRCPGHVGMPARQAARREASPPSSAMATLPPPSQPVPLPG